MICDYGLVDDVSGDAMMSGVQFAEWRGRLNLTQQEAGVLLDKTERTIAYYESGKRPVPFAIYIACMAYEDWPWLRRRIRPIIAKRSKGDS